jgi:hypothetical protein
METSDDLNEREIRAMVTRHFMTLPIGPLSDERREKIIENSLSPALQLLSALRQAAAAGPNEEAVLRQFVRELYGRAEAAKREHYFAHVLRTLTEHRNVFS